MKKLKPFDVQAALSGEPAMLRDGSKVYIRHHETELSTEVDKKLLGYIEGGGAWSWCVDGAFLSTGGESKYDIIGMYPKTRTINGFEVPAPETEGFNNLTDYYLASPTSEKFFLLLELWIDAPLDKLWLKRGLVFLDKEDAIANAKAMLCIDPDNPSMD